MSELEQASLGRDEAIKIYDTKWWTDADAKFVFERQMKTLELIMDFGEFQRATQEVLGRPVWTHEFARPQLLWDEYEGRRIVTDPIATSLKTLSDIMGEKL